ncbi:MAG: hypothetical protein EVA89_19765, partial [Sandaracinaceae bacterium]
PVVVPVPVPVPVPVVVPVVVPVPRRRSRCRCRSRVRLRDRIRVRSRSRARTPRPRAARFARMDGSALRVTQCGWHSSSAIDGAGRGRASKGGLRPQPSAGFGPFGPSSLTSPPAPSGGRVRTKGVRSTSGSPQSG